jgi:two-component system sensor histidine kinase/response regulator
MIKNQGILFTAKGNQFAKLTVLVVDTLDNMRNAVASMLSDIGIAKVYQANNGTEALKYLSRSKVDVILSEWQLNDMEGIELLNKIRKHTQTREIPFIITSANVEHKEVVRAIKCGVSEYIVKPYSPKILEERISRALSTPVKHNVNKTNPQKGKQATKELIQILIVDDMPDNIQVVSELLKSEYKIQAATNGEKALKICMSKSQPDIVLLDIMMPGMNGLEVCKRLKSNLSTEHITVIFLSALDQTKHIIKGFELGAVDYISKPVNPPEVKARVRTHAKNVESQKLLRLQVDTMIENERLKQEFDQVMQSDLKQPVIEVLKSVELINRYAKDAKKVKQYNESIGSLCGFMEQLIDNMLLLNKLEEGNYILVPTKIDLHTIFNKVFQSFKALYSEKRLEINNEVGVESFVSAEQMLTHSLLVNLVKNAIEAAPRGSALTIKVAEVDNFRVLKIHNQGSIPDEIHDNFFGKYVTAGKKQGSGIGTYAAKLMADIQKGDIDFESSKLDGTTLMVALPIIY